MSFLDTLSSSFCIVKNYYLKIEFTVFCVSIIFQEKNHFYERGFINYRVINKQISLVYKNIDTCLRKQLCASRTPQATRRRRRNECNNRINGSCTYCGKLKGKNRADIKVRDSPLSNLVKRNIMRIFLFKYKQMIKLILLSCAQ